ncbi:MAG: hypothetical protein ABIS59_01820, partial [Candidatus Saccharibacteria bacterium]
MSSIYDAYTEAGKCRDTEFVRLFEEACNGKILCTAATVEIEIIKPYSQYRPELRDIYCDYFYDCLAMNLL